MTSLRMTFETITLLLSIPSSPYHGVSYSPSHDCRGACCACADSSSGRSRSHDREGRGGRRG